MKHLTNLAILFLMLLGVSCQSSLSDQKVDNLSLIKASIEITQSLTNKSKNHVRVDLYDKNGDKINNKDIAVEVNNILLDTVSLRQLYYTSDKYYGKLNVPVNDIYQLEIKLSDNKYYYLGSVSAIEESNERDINCAELGVLNRDFMISWKKLHDVNQLEVSRSILMKNSTEQDKSFDYAPNVIIREINHDGEYIVRKSDFQNDKWMISSLGIKFIAQKFGETNPGLLKGSKIKITGHIDKQVDFGE